MRRVPVKILESLNLDLETTIVTQNDADEIVNRISMYHVAHCEPRALPIFVPVIMMKRNTNWLKLTSDLRKFNVPLNRFRWKQGVYFWPLQKVLEQKTTMRNSDGFDESKGIGAGIHLSSSGILFTLFLKRFGIIEKIRQSFSFSDRFVQKASAKELTWGTILVEMERMYKHDFCDQITDEYKMVHVSELDRDSFLFWQRSLPWSLRKYPDRFCSLHPSDTAKEAELYRNLCPSHWYSSVRRSKEKFFT